MKSLTFKGVFINIETKPAATADDASAIVDRLEIVIDRLEAAIARHNAESARLRRIESVANTTLADLDAFISSNG